MQFFAEGVCLLSFIYISLHVARRAMAAACRCPLGQQWAFLVNLILPWTSLRSHSGHPQLPTLIPREVGDKGKDKGKKNPF